MADVTVSGTLVANTVTVVQVEMLGGVEVVNRTGSGEIWFTFGAPGQPATPTVGGAGCFCVPAAVCAYGVPWPEPTANPSMEIEVQLISASAESFAVVATPWGQQ